MDPRHPELAISRIRELMKQYDRIEKDMAKATTSAKLAELEREGGLVIQEICLVAPRIHEAMMQTSRQRRVELARQILIPSTDEETKKSLEFFKEAEKVDEPMEKQHMGILEMAEVLTDPAPIPVVEQLKEVGTEHLDFLEEETPTPKKKPTKKKTTKKAEKSYVGHRRSKKVN